MIMLSRLLALLASCHVLVGSVVAAAASQVIDESWYATIKYEAIGQDGSCAATDATSLFVRRPGPGGCNPTFSGNPNNFASWHATCNANANEEAWDITWYSSTDSSCAGPVALMETKAVPTCEVNNKGETESFHCYADLESSTVFQERDNFSVQLGVYRDNDCNEDSFFLYNFIAPDTCLNQGDISVTYSPNTPEEGFGTRTQYIGLDCTGPPDDVSPVPVQVCFPFAGTDAGIVAYAKILSFDPDNVSALLPELSPPVPEPSPEPSGKKDQETKSGKSKATKSDKKTTKATKESKVKRSKHSN